MLIGRYLQWVETAPVCARIDAARTLVEAYEGADVEHAGRADCELALCALLDDPAATVRRALSEAVAFSTDVPRHLVVALAQDHAAVAAPVLQFSPLLGDADLVDAAAIGDSRAQVAIARRAVVHAPLAAALAEVGSLDAAIALCDNPNAALPPPAMRRLVARFGHDGTLREALLARDDLDAVVRHDLVEATAHALTAFVTDCNWLSPERAERIGRESCDKATVTIALQARDEGVEASRELATHLRARGVLTPALLLRSILSGNTSLFEAALADLTKLPAARVAGQLRDVAGLGFASLFARAKLPPLLLPLFRSALAAAGQDDPDVASGALRRPVIARVLKACDAHSDSSLAKASALLRRFEAEALRDEARAVTTAAWADDDGEAMPALMPWIIGSIQTAPRLTLQAA